MKSATRDGPAPRANGKWERVYLPVAAFATVLLVAVTILTVPADRGELLVKLFTGLDWLLVLLVAAVAFRSQAQALADAIVERVKNGASFSVGSFFKMESLPEAARRIPSPATATDPVSLANIALLHTSFFRPDKTREIGDGLTYYQFEVIVMAPDDVLARVESVRYELEKAWREDLRVQTITDRASRFKMKELANGTSIVLAKVKLRDQEQPVVLNRFLDLRPDGPRI